MAPGGLRSAGTGAWPAPLAAADAGAVLPAAPGVPELAEPGDAAPPPAASAVMSPPARPAPAAPEPPHAASAVMSPAAARALPERRQSPSGFLLSGMARFYRGADEAMMNPAVALGSRVRILL